MLARRVLVGAALVAALAPMTPSASASAQMCRIVIDPRAVWTPVGVVQVPMVYCVSP